MRLRERDADDPAAVIAAIAEVPAVGNEKRVIENRERAALIVNSGSETFAAYGAFDIDRPAGKYRPILQRECEDPMFCGVLASDQSGDVQRLRTLIDNRRPRDPERVDIAAGKR